MNTPLDLSEPSITLNIEKAIFIFNSSVQLISERKSNQLNLTDFIKLDATSIDFDSKDEQKIRHSQAINSFVASTILRPVTIPAHYYLLGLCV